MEADTSLEGDHLLADHMVGGESSVAVLTGAVYAQAPDAEKARCIEFLLKPLGVMAAAVVANGVFARLVWDRLHAGRAVAADDIRGIQVQDVVKLAARVQDLGLQAFEQLARAVAASPALATTAASAALIALLACKVRSGAGGGDPDLDPPSV